MMDKIKRFLPLIGIIIAMIAAFAFGLDEKISFANLHENEMQLKTLVAQHPFLSKLSFILLYMIVVALSLPVASIMTLASGLIFGPFMGGLLAVLGATSGACIIFLATKSAFGNVLRQKAGPRVQQFEAGFQRNAISYLLTVRLIPIFPFFLINIAAAIVGVSLPLFALTTLIGIAPGSFIYASVGNGISVILAQGGVPDLGIIFDPRFFLPLTALGLLVLSPALWRVWQEKKTSGETHQNAPIKADICIIGAGAGGLSVAAGAAQMGAKCVLIESDKMGGDCLNYGCVPSKALLAASQMAAHIDKASQFGIMAELLKIDFQQVHKHIEATISSIAPHDSVERFESLGVQVIQAQAQFISTNTVKAGDAIIRARRFVIATGAKTFIPAIPGLRHVTYYTNETIFNLTSAPKHLIIIGAGAMGVEMAQAYCRLGCKVTLLEADKILPQNDREVAAFIADKLRAEGVTILEKVHIIKIEEKNGAPELNVEIEGNIHVISGSHLLLATGRKANFEPLDLAKANIRSSKTGIEVDQRLRTSNKKIFAIGDVLGAPQFTHAAGYQAGIVIRNALFRIPAKADYRIMPRVIYTEPELAELGLRAADIEAQGEEGRVLYHKFANNDRARTEQDMEGFIKITTTQRGKILGVIIVGKNAGDLLAPWILALQQGLSIASMANMIAPYPTRSEVAKHAAGSFYTPTLFSKKTKHFVRFLSWFG